jgi:hypothetical protein
MAISFALKTGVTFYWRGSLRVCPVALNHFTVPVAMSLSPDVHEQY